MKEIFELIKELYNLLNNNREFITLLITIIVALITLISTFITRKMLILSSQPTIKIDTEDIHITPDIKENLNSSNVAENIKDDTRYWFNLSVKVTNIGNNPAQNICVDGTVTFIRRNPLGYKALPTHQLNCYNIISSANMENGNSITTIVCFDNFVAREIIKDFYESYKYEKMFPNLPTSRELKDKRFWHSPKIKINCFYCDIQGNHYCTSQEHFFHMWYDDKNGKEEIYLLNMENMNFQQVRKVTKRFRDKYFKNSRHLRYTAFDGSKYNKNTLQSYRIVKKTDHNRLKVINVFITSILSKRKKPKDKNK